MPCEDGMRNSSFLQSELKLQFLFVLPSFLVLLLNLMHTQIAE